MIVQYNGVDLEVERVVGWSDRIVYSEDNMERLYRHVSMVVQCIVHPMATTISALQPVTGSQVVVDLKRRLLEPRKLLRVRIAGNEVLRSPALVASPDLPGTFAFGGGKTHYCDAKGGPHPLYVDVVSIHGTKTLLVTFAIETWLVDSSALEAQPGDDVKTDTSIFSAMISHRWTQSNSLDRSYYNTRTINGRAVFRADYLYTLNSTTGGLQQIAKKAGDYIADVSHPLPLNHKRESVNASVSSDGLTLTYTIVDEEQHLTTRSDRPVASIHGTYRSGISQAADMTGIVPELPRYFASLSITAVGRRGATREQLVLACIKAATTFDPNAGLSRRMHYSNEISFTIGRKAPTATFTLGYQVSGLKSFVADGISWAFSPPGEGGFANVLFKFPEQLNGGLGDPMTMMSAGMEPYEGMVGGGVQGQTSGQSRFNTQQILDGQYVPPAPPSGTTLQENNLTLEASDARVARGDDLDEID